MSTSATSGKKPGVSDISLIQAASPQAIPEELAAKLAAFKQKKTELVAKNFFEGVREGTLSAATVPGTTILNHRDTQLLERRAQQDLLNNPTLLKDMFKTLMGRDPREGELEFFKKGAADQIKRREEKAKKAASDGILNPEEREAHSGKFRRKLVRNLAKGEQQCGGCEKTSKSFLKCSKCKEVVYCSKECQTAQWPTHKLVCVIPTSGAGAGAGASSAASKS